MRKLFTVVAAVTLAACDRAFEPAAPGSNPSIVTGVNLTQVSQDSTPTQDEVATAVPGFGGYFIDASGRPAVYLTDPTQRPAAEQALAAFLASRGFTASDLVVLQGSFEYAQLAAWYRQVKPNVFAVAGAILGDVDEGQNRIRLGVADANAAAAVQSAVTAAGIPSGAVIIQQRAPFTTVATLRDQVRPMVGGLQINFFVSPPGIHPGSFLCTLGFSVVRYGVNGFITNSHCTNVEGGEETPTDYYQNRRSTNPSDLIAVELDDPHWTSYLNLDCPPPLACRYSDAALTRYTSNATFKLGELAKVDEITTSLDDTLHTIAGAFRIKSEQSDPVQGEPADKVGRTTGWTTGTTTGTCVDVLALGTTHIRLCQAIVGAIVDGGDSGSPVFRRRTGSNVSLLGVLWGGSVDDTNPEFVYSPLSGIEREIGPLKTH